MGRDSPGLAKGAGRMEVRSTVLAGAKELQVLGSWGVREFP